MNHYYKPIRWVLLLSWIAIAIPFLNAQTEEDEEVFELNPFYVDEDENEGYLATATLAGTRVRTDLRDLASPISIVTKQFLTDTGVTNSQDLLVYTTNTEVGGIFGNFAGVGNTQGVGETSNLEAPSTNTRVRGLDAADNTRNYFITDIPWDGYNVDRVELQRGPNSILFGVGSPAGIINTSTVIPKFVTEGKYENRIGSFGSMRNTLDYNQVLVDDVLAARVVLLHDKAKFKQEPAFEKDKRGFVAITFNPDWFGEDAQTRITANFEKGKIDANRPRSLPPVDNITAWWGGLDQRVYNASWSWANDIQIDRGNGTVAARNPSLHEPWLGNDMGNVTGGGVGFFYNNGDSTPSIIRQTDASLNFGIDLDGVIDRGISSFPFSRLQGIAGYNEYSKNAEASANANGLPNPFPAASKNFYKDLHLNDPGVFDFYNNLIDGLNKAEFSDWHSFNVALSQTFWQNRLGFEFVYDYQNYETGNDNLLGWRPTIGVDINTHTDMIPVTYPGAIQDVTPDPTTVTGGDPNPNVGRAFISGGRPRANTSKTIRDNYRFTAFTEIKGSDFFEDGSFLARLIGRNVFTGLLSKNEKRSTDNEWLNFATGTNYASVQDNSIQVDGWERGVSYVTYLSDDLRSVSSPWNLNLPRLQNRINPAGQYTVQFFDSHWNASGVDPAADYTLPVDGAASTQSENWQNYVGYGPMEVNILNAAEGDREQLMTSASKANEVLDSYGVTWQGYWWDGTIVPTVGWRHDEIENWGTAGPQDSATGVRSVNFSNPRIEGDTFISDGETVTWGVVGHSDRWLADKLPGGTHFSLFYNKSENFRAVNRVGYSGVRLPSPSGESEDYGIVLNTLDDKLTLKVTWYETLVSNADIGSSSPLGSNSWFIESMEAWVTASALTHELYWNGDLPGMSWMSNYGLVDDNHWGAEGWENAPFSDEAINHPANQALFAAVEDWYANMIDQSFFDGYGFDIDASLANGSYEDRKNNMISNWDPYSGIGSIQSSGGGKINGLDPTMTIDQASKGVEFELQYRPVRNWNITVNASKTEAVRKDLGKAIRDLIEYQYEKLKGPSGDIRLWWGGDQIIRTYYDQYVYQAYLFQLDANGQSAPEIRPWRFNAITNYSFEDGPLDGMNIGGAVRWQDDVILGYNLDSTQTKLDVTNPITGGAETNVDLWIGYNRKLTNRVDWRIQLNLRNVGKDDDLIPVSVNPDGSMAVGRISDGMTWEITNSFNF